MNTNPPPLIWDTSCLVNLVASGFAEPILRVLPFQSVLLREMQREEMHYVRSAKKEDSIVDLPVEIEKLRVGSLLTYVEPNATDAEARIRWASIIDGGESDCFALVETRGFAVAIDDRRAIRDASKHLQNLRHLTTPDWMHVWAQSAGTTIHDIRTAIDEIEARARFRCRKEHLLYSWWRDIGR